MTTPGPFSEMSRQELLTLMRYHASQAAAAAAELAAREAAESETGGGGARQHLAANGAAASPAGSPEPEWPNDSRWAMDYAPSRSKADGALIETVLHRGSEVIQEAAIQIIEETASFEGVGAVIPERPRDKKPPAYVRFARYGRTFGYLQVRRDHLRIDLAIPGEEGDALGGKVRKRDVKSTNPLQVSIYVRGAEDTDDAIEALRYAHEYGSKKALA
jgi:hypothetical protein